MPGTFLVLELEVPCPGKPLSPGQTRMADRSIATKSNKGGEGVVAELGCEGWIGLPKSGRDQKGKALYSALP